MNNNGFQKMLEELIICLEAGNQYFSCAKNVLRDYQNQKNRSSLRLSRKNVMSFFF